MLTKEQKEQLNEILDELGAGLETLPDELPPEEREPPLDELPPPLLPLCWALAESATNRHNAPFKATVVKYLYVFFMIV